MKFLRGLGWFFVPFIMIFARWKNIGVAGKVIGTPWAVIVLIIWVSTIASGNKGNQPSSNTNALTTTNSDQNTPKTQTKSNPAPNPQPPYTIASDGTSYKGANVSNVGIAVAGVDTADTVGPDMMTQKADGKFVIVHILVKNEQNDAITLTSSEFNIIDSQGKKYSDSTNGTTYYSMQNQNEKDLFLNQLNPGVVTKGFVVYDVPKDLDLSTAKLEARGGFTGSTTELPLSAQKS